MVTLNLLKSKQGRRADYEAYARGIVPHPEAAESEVLYEGDCSTLLAGPDG